MKLTRLSFTKKQRIISALSALILTALLVFAWVWFSHQQYQAAYQQQKQLTEARLNRANIDLNDNRENEDFLLDGYLNILQQDLQNIAKQMPANPRIFSLSLLSSEQQQANQNIAAAFKQADDQLSLSYQLSHYQSQLAPVLAKLNQGQAADAEQQAQLATTWSQAHQHLSNIIVPQASQNFSQKLLSTIEDISSDFTDLSELYKKTNQAEFLTKKSELTPKYDSFDKLATDHLALIKAQDEQLRQSLAGLQQAFK